MSIKLVDKNNERLTINPKKAPLNKTFFFAFGNNPMTKPIKTLLNQVANINNSLPKKPILRPTPIMQKIPKKAPKKTDNLILENVMIN